MSGKKRFPNGNIEIPNSKKRRGEREIDRAGRAASTMVKLTMIVRLSDGLPLCEGLELDKIANMEMYKQQAKVSASTGGAGFRARALPLPLPSLLSSKR